MSSHGHYIKKCNRCDTIIGQCRCMAKDKIEIYELCSKCKDMKPRKAEDIIKNMRGLEIDHKSDGWPAVQMKEITELCDMVENAIPSLALLQCHLAKGDYIEYQEGEWWLFAKNGEGIISGKSIRSMLVNLIFLEC